MSTSFETLIGRLPWDTDTMVGKGIGYFIRQQKPESVEFVKAPNGWMIKVRTREANVEEAQEFWKEYVEPNLGETVSKQ